MKAKKILFAMFALACVMAVSMSFSSCSKDDDSENLLYYSLGFSKMNGNFTEMAFIDDTFKEALGVSTDEFTSYAGGDEKIKSNCDKACREFDQYGEELSGHCARFAYRLMNFCVKAEEVSLLPIEALIDGDLVKLDDCSIVGKKDEYTFMVIPNFAEDMAAIAQGVMMEHPEFKQSMEEMTLDTVDEEGRSIKKDIHYLLLKMPVVDDERYKVLKDGVEVVYNDCKAAMELANTKGEANITPLLVGETEEDIEKLNKVRDKVKAEWTDHREKLYHDKLQEIEDAHNEWMADRVEETLTRMQDEAAHNEDAGSSMKLNPEDY